MTEEQVKAMNEDMEEIHKEELEQHTKDQELLEKIKERIPEEEFELIKEEIVLSENTANYRIIDKPIGDLQEEEGVKIWIDQNSAGESGDVFVGTVCMGLPDGKFIMWDYWM